MRSSACTGQWGQKRCEAGESSTVEVQKKPRQSGNPGQGREVLVPNCRSQKLLLQQLTNKTFISGYLRKWRVLTCPEGQRKNATRSLPAICWKWLLSGDPSWRPAWSNVLCGQFLFIPWKDNMYFNARAWGGVQFWEDHSQQALAILMAGAAPVPRRPAHEKVNGFGLRSQHMDMTGSPVPAEWGLQIRCQRVNCSSHQTSTSRAARLLIKPV